MPHCPMKFRMVRGRLTAPAPRILDIGCGNGSPTVTKRWFPGCHYAGADIQRYKLSDADMAAMDEFYPLSIRWVGLRRDSRRELRFRDSESRGGAHARPASRWWRRCAPSSSRADIYGSRFLRCAVCRCRIRWTRRCSSRTILRMCMCRMCARWRIFCWRMEWPCCTRAVRARDFLRRLPTW